MPNLPLLSAFGLDASGSLAPDAKITHIFPDFKHWQSTRLDEVRLSTGTANLTFSQPVSLPLPGLSLVVGEGMGGHIQILTSKDRVLDSDPFQSIEIAPEEIYVSLTLQLSATGGVDAGSGFFAFGLSLERGITLTVYQRFVRSNTGTFPPFGNALARTLSAFALPRTMADLNDLHRDTVIIVAGEGKLNLTASFTIETSVQQLVATSPVAGRATPVNTGAEFSTGFNVTLASGYQARLRKLDGGALEIGIYTSRSRELATKVSAGVALPATAASFDLTEKLIGAVSANTAVDLKELRQALPGEDPAARDAQIAAFQTDLGDAIATQIEARLSVKFSQLTSKEAALTFEISPGTIDSPATSSALLSALKGNFTALTAAQAALPAGVRQTSNLFTTTQLAKHQLNINLLGILNFVSVGKLARICKIERDAEGQITCVTDTSDATRLQATLRDVAGTTKRLQSMLSEDFLLQASFKTTQLQVLPAEFSAKHTFFEIESKTDRHRMKDLLNVCCALGLLTQEESAARLGGNDQFGRTTFWLQTAYSEASIEHTFLNQNGTARAASELETIGRRALGLLLAGDDDQEFRKRVADLGPQGTSLWQQMKLNGNTANFNPLFGLPLGVPDPRVAAAAADFLCITYWAAAMNELGGLIVETRALLGSSVTIEDIRLKALRQTLRDRMAKVVKYSGEHFGEPLGLLMVYLASQHSAAARVLVTGSLIPTLTKAIGPGTS